VRKPEPSHPTIQPELSHPIIQPEPLQPTIQPEPLQPTIQPEPLHPIMAYSQINLNPNIYVKLILTLSYSGTRTNHTVEPISPSKYL